MGNVKARIIKLERVTTNDTQLDKIITKYMHEARRLVGQGSEAIITPYTEEEMITEIQNADSGLMVKIWQGRLRVLKMRQARTQD